MGVQLLLTWCNSCSRLSMLLFVRFSSTQKKKADIPANRDEIQHVQSANIFESEHETGAAVQKIAEKKRYSQKQVTMSPQSRWEEWESFSVVLRCLRPRQCILFTWCVATPPAGGAQPIMQSLFVYILLPPRKRNKSSKESHFSEMFFCFPSH